MPKKINIGQLPLTPKGFHFKFADISADEIVIDDEICIKSSVFRSPKKTDVSFSELSDSRKRPRSEKKKFVIRKSMDLKKFKNIDDRMEALIASPMIEVRRRPLGYSKSFTESDANQTTSPLHVPSKNDLTAVTSRRVSAFILSKYEQLSQSMPALGRKGKSVCPEELNQGRRSEISKDTPIRRSLVPRKTDLGGSLHVSNDDSAEPFRDTENQPPLEPEPMVHFGPEDTHPSVASNTASEFRMLLSLEMSRISEAKSAWESVIGEEGKSIPDIALESIRNNLDRCDVLLSSKFPFFNQIINLAENSLNFCESQQQSLPDLRNLLAYWENIAKEIAEIDVTFERLRVWRDSTSWTNNKNESPTPSSIPAAVELSVKFPSKIPRAKNASIASLTESVAEQLKMFVKSPKRILRTSLSGKLPVSADFKTPKSSKIPASLLSRKVHTDAPIKMDSLAQKCEHWEVPQSSPRGSRGRPRKLLTSPNLAVAGNNAQAVSSFDSPSINDLNNNTPQMVSRTQFGFMKPTLLPIRPTTGTPMPKFTSRVASSTPSIVPPPAPYQRQQLLPSPIVKSNACPPVKPITPIRRGRKSVRFSSNLWTTPGGHSGDAAHSPISLSVTPHTSISIDPSMRILRSRRSTQIIEHNSSPVGEVSIDLKQSSPDSSTRKRTSAVANTPLSASASKKKRS